jgi:hypothetical protein
LRLWVAASPPSSSSSCMMQQQQGKQQQQQQHVGQGGAAVPCDDAGSASGVASFKRCWAPASLSPHCSMPHLAPTSPPLPLPGPHITPLPCDMSHAPCPHLTAPPIARASHHLPLVAPPRAAPHLLLALVLVAVHVAAVLVLILVILPLIVLLVLGGRLIALQGAGWGGGGGVWGRGCEGSGVLKVLPFTQVSAAVRVSAQSPLGSREVAPACCCCCCCCCCDQHAHARLALPICCCWASHSPPAAAAGRHTRHPPPPPHPLPPPHSPAQQHGPPENIHMMLFGVAQAHLSPAVRWTGLGCMQVVSHWDRGQDQGTRSPGTTAATHACPAYSQQGSMHALLLAHVQLQAG